MDPFPAQGAATLKKIDRILAENIPQSATLEIKPAHDEAAQSRLSFSCPAPRPGHHPPGGNAEDRAVNL
jgi:hypothetical protein